jgi:hypothetical protein
MEASYGSPPGAVALQRWVGPFSDLDADRDDEAWALRRGALVRLRPGADPIEIEGPAAATRLAVRGAWIAVAGEELWLIDAATGACAGRWSIHGFEVLALGIEPDGAVVLVGRDTEGHPTDRCSWTARCAPGTRSMGRRGDLRDAFDPPPLPLPARAGALHRVEGTVRSSDGAAVLAGDVLALAPTPSGGWVRTTAFAFRLGPLPATPEVARVLAALEEQRAFRREAGDAADRGFERLVLETQARLTAQLEAALLAVAPLGLGLPDEALAGWLPGGDPPRV